MFAQHVVRSLDALGGCVVVCAFGAGGGRCRVRCRRWRKARALQPATQMSQRWLTSRLRRPVEQPRQQRQSPRKTPLMNALQNNAVKPTQPINFGTGSGYRHHQRPLPRCVEIWIMKRLPSSSPHRHRQEDHRRQSPPRRQHQQHTRQRHRSDPFPPRHGHMQSSTPQCRQ